MSILLDFVIYMITGGCKITDSVRTQSQERFYPTKKMALTKIEEQEIRDENNS